MTTILEQELFHIKARAIQAALKDLDRQSNALSTVRKPLVFMAASSVRFEKPKPVLKCVLAQRGGPVTFYWAKEKAPNNVSR